MKQMIKEYYLSIREEILGNVISSFIYIISSIYYLLNLNRFNRLYGGLKDAFKVMSIEDGIAWKLLSFAFVFTILGSFLFYLFMKKWRNIQGASKMTLICLGLCIFIIIIIILKDINNPILQSALVVLFVGSIVALAN